MAEGCCDLCPRHCRTVRPAGFCGSPREPVVARAGLHFWEEPVISGKRGSGAVFFSGCNLRCVFCQNYAISAQHEGKTITVARLREIFKELIDKGAHNINLVTPTHYTEAILEALDTPLPVPVVWNSNGYESVETLKKLRGKVQIFLPDLKYAEEAPARRYSSAPDYFATACAAIDEMYAQTGPFELDNEGMLKRGVVIRHLILPGQVKNSLKVIDCVRRRFKPGEVLFSLMRQYLPCGKVSDTEYPELNRRITNLEYRKVEKTLFESGIEDGFVQEAESASREFIPLFDGSGVAG